jgi:atypical dual specificity phosphatase
MMNDKSEFAKMMNFSWIEDGVAGCRGPSPYELHDLHALGVDALVRVNDKSMVTAAQVEAAGMADHFESVEDWTAPTQEQIDRVIRFMKSQLLAGRSVAVSCGAGRGRTGTILACFLADRGRSPKEAIEHLISVRPGSSEIRGVEGQLAAIELFARRRGH